MKNFKLLISLFMILFYFGCDDERYHDCPPDKSVCGDGVWEPEHSAGNCIIGEVCDGTYMYDEITCENRGFAGGVVRCDENCELDYSGCNFRPVCGDGIINREDEECDTGKDESRPLEKDCSYHGFYKGQVYCSKDCKIITDDCTEYCGDGIVQKANESCDGTLIGEGVDCTSFGYTGGPVSCGSTCRYDYSLCYSVEDPDMGVITCSDTPGMGSDYYVKYTGAYYPYVYWIAYNKIDIYNPYSTIYSFNIETKTRTIIAVIPYIAPYRALNLVIKPEDRGIYFTLENWDIPNGCTQDHCFIHTGHLFRLDMDLQTLEELPLGAPLETQNCLDSHGEVMLIDYDPDTGDAVVFCDAYLNLPSCYEGGRYIYSMNINSGDYITYFDKYDAYITQEAQSFYDLNKRYYSPTFFRDWVGCSYSGNPGFGAFEIGDNYEVQQIWSDSVSSYHASATRQVGPEGWVYRGTNIGSKLQLQGINVITGEEILAPVQELNLGKAAAISLEYPNLVGFVGGENIYYGGDYAEPAADVVGIWDKNTDNIRLITTNGTDKFYEPQLLQGAPDSRYMLLRKLDNHDPQVVCLYYKDMVNAGILTLDGTLIPDATGI